jgi:hypothetical protein
MARATDARPDGRRRRRVWKFAAKLAALSVGCRGGQAVVRAIANVWKRFGADFAARKPPDQHEWAIARVKDAPEARRAAAGFSTEKPVLDTRDRPPILEPGLCKQKAPQSPSKPNFPLGPPPTASPTRENATGRR